jgi:hypothetical protein
MASTPAVGSLFFRLGGVQLLHNVLTYIFVIVTEDLAASLTTSGALVYFRVSLTFPLLSSHSCCFRPWSLMLLLNFGCVHLLFSNVCPLWVCRTSSSFIHLFRGFRYPTAGSWSIDRSSGALIVSTVTSSLGTS